MTTTIEHTIILRATVGLDIQVTNHYSGRGMYGQECFGITFDDRSEITEFYLNLTDDGHPALARELNSRSHQDSMGLGTIIYFPGFTLDEWPQEGDG